MLYDRLISEVSFGCEGEVAFAIEIAVEIGLQTDDRLSLVG